jgi:hypothetical protein
MNLLWSYAYARNFDMDDFLGSLQVQRLRFFADSGAHSARTLGIHIGLEDYAKWVLRWRHWFTIYANLDVIGGADATRVNQRRLEEEYGLEPMPVFHTGEPFSVLESYIEDGYTYIALGKLLGNAVDKLRPWLRKAFRIAEGHAVFHGFGMTNWQILKEFPFYSVDSSSWSSGFRYGTLKLFHRGSWVSLRLRDRDAVWKHRTILDSYRIPYASLTKDGYDKAIVAGACATAMYRSQEWLRERHGLIPLPPGKGYPSTYPQRPARSSAESSPRAVQSHPSGLHLYLADANQRRTGAAARAIQRERPAA